MRTFIADDRVWPEGQTKLHVYLIPSLDEIKTLVEVYREAMDEFAFLSPVADEWLHVTVQMIDHPTRDISPDQLVALETTLRQQLSSLAPFTLNVGGAVAGRSGVVLDLTPDEEFTAVIHRTRAVIRDVLGDTVVRYTPSRPHITLAYARDDGDSGIVGSRLRNATDQRATLIVSELRLVDVIQDQVQHQYRWNDVARIPLDHSALEEPEGEATGARCGLGPQSGRAT